MGLESVLVGISGVVVLAALLGLGAWALVHKAEGGAKAKAEAQVSKETIDAISRGEERESRARRLVRNRKLERMQEQARLRDAQGMPRDE